jgi:multidrug efflux pump subunit AcrA (membrane-fusion protein)
MSQESHPHHISAWKVILVIGFLVAAVAAIAVTGYIPRRERQRAANAAAQEVSESLPRVTSAMVRRAPADVDIALPGSISALSEASIYARAAGYVRKRHVDIGDRVKEGQLLAEIEAPELDQQVAQARAAFSQAQQQLAQVRAALVQAQAQRDLAKVTSERYSGLIAKGAVSRQDADVQQASFKTADALVAAQESSVRASEENIHQAQANLDRILALQEYKNVRAPMAGVITARNIEVGSLISATGGGQGASANPTAASGASGNELFRVAQTRTVRILESVPQSTAVSILPGMSTEVSVLEFGNRKFAGKVVRSSNALDPASRTMLVEVQVNNADGKLIPGMYAEVRFRSHRPSPPFLIPGDAVIAGAVGPRVAVLLDAADSKPGGKKVHLQAVQIGRDYGAQTEITGGLTGTEMVVVNPGDDVREGALVLADAQKGAGK